MRFSGHESFHCRPYWLKKGFDFNSQSRLFSDPEAPVYLGVGKNMVSSIRFWLKSFGIVDKDENIEGLSMLLFSDDGWDPYLEDEGTLWLLHYKLITEGYASIYYLVFNELRRKRPIFNQKHFLDLVKEKQITVSPNTLKTDFQAFNRTYVAKSKGKDIEDNFSGILTELNLVNETPEGLEIEPKNRQELPLHILLFCILETNPDTSSISFELLYNEDKSVGRIFALSQQGLNQLLEELDEEFDWLNYSNEAGIRELQIKKRPVSNIKILEEYYAD